LDEAGNRAREQRRAILTQENGSAPLTPRAQLILAGSGSTAVCAKRDGQIARHG
jgi:hypothetical protein